MKKKLTLKLKVLQWADDIQVGIMIEIPAAAMLADQFAKKLTSSQLVQTTLFNTLWPLTV